MSDADARHRCGCHGWTPAEENGISYADREVRLMFVQVRALAIGTERVFAGGVGIPQAKTTSGSACTARNALFLAGQGLTCETLRFL